MNTKKIFYAVLGLSLFISCSTDSDSLETNSDPEIAAFELNSRQLPSDVEEAIISSGLNPSNYQYKEFNLLQGMNRAVIVTSEDIAYSKEEFMNMLSNNDEPLSKQYATEFLVNTNTYSVINLYVYVGADEFGLTPGAVQGVEDAVNNWNTNKFIPTSIKFDITIGTDQNYDTNVFETVIVSDPSAGGFGGFAEFPRSNNSPGSFVVISPDANQFASQLPNAIKHLITHELGHTIGFRHTDWDTRRSCVEAGLADQEVSEESANYIFGTPPTFFYQSNSIMNACFNINTTSGELNVFDSGALFNLYPRYR
jgi:hypothetical protein